MKSAKRIANEKEMAKLIDQYINFLSRQPLIFYNNTIFFFTILEKDLHLTARQETFQMIQIII